jgi:hypothetical protein
MQPFTVGLLFCVSFGLNRGMKSGRKVVALEMKDANKNVVLKATAEVEQPKTAYVFTGQVCIYCRD